jgi:hypothetical protein
MKAILKPLIFTSSPESHENSPPQTVGPQRGTDTSPTRQEKAHLVPSRTPKLTAVAPLSDRAKPVAAEPDVNFPATIAPLPHSSLMEFAEFSHPVDSQGFSALDAEAIFKKLLPLMLDVLYLNFPHEQTCINMCSRIWFGLQKDLKKTKNPTRQAILFLQKTLSLLPQKKPAPATLSAHLRLYSDFTGFEQFLLLAQFKYGIQQDQLSLITEETSAHIAAKTHFLLAKLARTHA